MTARRMKACNALAAAAFALTAANASAESLCAALQGILKDANNDFQSYRGSFDFMFDEYTGTRVIPPLQECRTSSADGVATYACEMKGLPDDVDKVRPKFNAIHEQLISCLGPSVKVTRKDASRITYRYLPEDKTMTLRFRRVVMKSQKSAVPPSYSISLSIEAVDPFGK